MAQTEKQANVVDEEAPFDRIGFIDMVLHTLFDMHEFGAHSFEGIEGPYFWNGMGLNFQTPMPMTKILEHAKRVKARTIYVAHTHPLSNDKSLKFLNAKIDPREKIAFAFAPLPLGNRPSSGDVTYFHQLKEEFTKENINIIGIIFSASGVWEYDILKPSSFVDEAFVKAYAQAFPIDRNDNFLREWSAKDRFPNYYMELRKPKMHEREHKRQITRMKKTPISQNSWDEEIARTIKFFEQNGVALGFHSYGKFGIDPQPLMRRTLARWSDVFA